MKDLNFYSDKTTSFLLLIISSSLVLAGYFTRENIINFEEKKTQSIILIISSLLFLSGVIISLILLFRRKPLLTITNEHLIIYNIFTTHTIVEIKNIKSFFIVNTYHRGIATNKQIYVELKIPTEEYRKTWYYKIINKISKPIANSQYAIQTNFINIKQKELLKILENKIKNVA